MRFFAKLVMPSGAVAPVANEIPKPVEFYASSRVIVEEWANAILKLHPTALYVHIDEITRVHLTNIYPVKP